MRLHFQSIIPIAAGAVSVGMGIALLSATGYAPNGGVDNTWMTLNTSRAGQSTVSISQVNQTDPNSDPNSLTGILTGLLNGFLGNLTNTVSGQFQDLQGEVIKNVTQAVGLKDAYLLFISETCEGNFYDRNDTSSLINVTKCYPYKDSSQGLRRISREIPSSFVVGTTNVSIPLVSVLGNTLGSLVDLATQGSAFMQAMLIIGVVCTGLTMAGSLVFVVALRRPPVAVAYLVLAVLGSAAFWVFAIAATAVAYGGRGLINGGGGSALGVEARTGSRFVAMAWVAAAVSSLAALHWWVVWFVEFRRHSYRKRARTKEQVGNYRNMLREIREDRTMPPGEEAVAKEAGMAASSGRPAAAANGGGV